MDKTITTIFMVPTLGIKREDLKDNGFINGYVKDSHRDVQYQDCIYLVFQPKNVDKFREFLDSEYERTKELIDDYNYEGGYVVVVYRLNPDYERDFKLVRQSKYSKTSKSFQALFPKTIRVKRDGIDETVICLQYRVFNKTEDLIQFWEERLDVKFDDDQEIWHAFEEENEILNINKMKKDV